MLIVGIAGESYVPVGSVNSDTKVVVKSRTLLNGVKNTNDNANGADINKITIVGSLKKRIDIWPLLIVVIASGELTKIIVFIIILIIGLGPISVGIIGVA